MKFSATSYILPKLSDMIFILIVTGVVLYGSQLFNLDGDLGRHITIGNYILETYSIPVKDIFSHTMTGESLVPHEWLAQIIFALAHQIMGLNGVVLLTAFILGLTFVIKYKEISEQGAPAMVILVVIVWAAALSSIHWLARPHIFTMLFLSIWSYYLEKFYRGEEKRLWIFPIFMLIWANTHGAFIAGFVVWGVYLFERIFHAFQNPAKWTESRQLFIIGATSFAVTFINPSGYLLWTTSLGYIQNSYLTSHTVEYMPPNFQNPTMWPFAFTIFYGLLSLSNKKKLSLRGSLLMAGWMLMSLFSMRNIPLFAIITIPAFASLLHKQTSRINWLSRLNEKLKFVEDQLRGGVWSVFILLLLGLLLFFGISLDAKQQGNKYDSQVFPVEAINWLEKNPQQGNMFNHFTWGGYILYRDWPNYQVFIDGQTDFYGEDLTREYESVISLSDGWYTIFEKYKISFVIIPKNSPLENALLEHGEWNIIYSDTISVILRKE